MKYVGIIIIALFVSGCAVPLAQNANTKEAIETSWSFAVIGDNEGENSYFTDMMKKIQADDDIDFVLHVGDMMARGGEKEITDFSAYLARIGFSKPLYAVPGNHDIKDDADRAAFQKEFGGLPRSIDAENLHLILLDNADRKVGFTDETLSWLEGDLKKASKENPNAKIVIAYHRPFGYPLADTLGDDETTASRKTNERFKAIITPYDIAQIFTGHIHTQMEFPYVISKDADGKTTKSVPVTVSGGGGQPPQDLFASLFSPDYHYIKVKVKKDGSISQEKISG